MNERASRAMKCGDLVRGINGSHWLHEGKDKPWDNEEIKQLLPLNILLEEGDLGLILGIAKMSPGARSYVKILTSKGIGWIFENRIEPM